MRNFLLNKAELKLHNDLAQAPNAVTEYRAARYRRYEAYANPPLKQPSKLVPVMVGVLATLYGLVGLYPKIMDQTEFTHDDPIFSDMSDRLVKAIFDRETYTWKKSTQGITLVPESLCDRSK